MFLHFFGVLHYAIRTGDMEIVHLHRNLSQLGRVSSSVSITGFFPDLERFCIALSIFPNSLYLYEVFVFVICKGIFFRRVFPCDCFKAANALVILTCDVLETLLEGSS